VLKPGESKKQPQMDHAAPPHGTNPTLLDIAILIGRVAIGLCFAVPALGELGVVRSGRLAGFAD